VTSALTRYRVAAYVVGVLLIVLTLVAVPLRYLAGEPGLVHVVGPLHGWLYLGYLVTGVDLANRMRWPVSRVLLVLLAGTVPFLSFVAERWVTRSVRAQLDAQPDGVPPARTLAR
jgi:integral membrane protein